MEVGEGVAGNRLVKKLDDRDDSNPASKCAIKMIKRMGKAIVIKRPRLRPSVLQFPAGQVPYSAGRFQLGVELPTVN